VQRPEQHGEADDQARGPDHEQQHERQRAEDAQKGFPVAARLHLPADVRPQAPGDPIEEPGETQLAVDAAGEDQGLEAFPQDRNENGEAEERERGGHHVGPL
jgi:hypothetical protein